jgi:hypothetical protein
VETLPPLLLELLVPELELKPPLLAPLLPVSTAFGPQAAKAVIARRTEHASVDRRFRFIGAAPRWLNACRHSVGGVG